MFEFNDNACIVADIKMKVVLSIDFLFLETEQRINFLQKLRLCQHIREPQRFVIKELF